MQPSTAQAGIQPARLLPDSWRLDSDVLLVVGEQAGAIAGPFVRHGLKRVITMYPPPIHPEPETPGAMVIRSHTELDVVIGTFSANLPQQYAIIVTPQCSLDRETTQGIERRLQTLLIQLPARQKAQDGLTPRWAINGMKNLPHLSKHPMVHDVGDAFRGTPVIIVGAGPSLAKNIDQLKAAQDKCVILCVNRALRSLQRADIWPDLAINYETQDVKCQFDGIDLSRIPGVILCSTSHPALFDLRARRILSYPGRLGFEGWMYEPGDGVPSVDGPSVSCSAISIALLLGFDPIILVGQDLSFPGGAVYHADGADGDTKAIRDEERNCWRLVDYSDDMAHTLRDNMPEGGPRFQHVLVPGHDGGMVPTSTQFAGFRSWMEQTALDHRGQVAMVNCTQGGAVIGGFAHRPLEDVLAGLSPRSVDVEAILDDPRVDAAVAKRQPKLVTRFDRLRTDLHKAHSLAGQAISLIDQTLLDPSHLPALQRVEAGFSAVRSATHLLSFMDQEAIRDVVAEAQRAGGLSKSLAASRKLYSLILEHSQRLL